MLYLSAGTKIRAFTLTECLGKGGMSAVWKARHAETGQDYSLKILHGAVVDDEQARQRFFEEGLIQSRVSHPNVVAVKGRIEEHPIHALVMEFVDGPALSEYISEQTEGLLLPEAKAVATGILSGLNAAHRRGIVHRDVKPSNVLLARDFYTITPKLTDFGIAKVKYGRLKTVTGSPLGTPHFMSPEQLRDSKRVTLKTDLYSFGVTLYHMVTGTYPFDSDDLNALGIKIIQGGHQPPSHYREELPPAVDELIERCMAPRPQDRPENCREVLESVLAIDWNQPTAPLRRKPPRKRPAAARSKPSARGPTPPPVPAAARTPAPPARRPPAPRPSLPVSAVESGEWQMSGGLGDGPFDDEAMARQFRRRGRLSVMLGLLALVALAALGTRLYLDWRANQDAEAVATATVETGTPETAEAVAEAPEPTAAAPLAAASPPPEGTGREASLEGSGTVLAEGTGADTMAEGSEVATAEPSPDGTLGATSGDEPSATELRLAMGQGLEVSPTQAVPAVVAATSVSDAAGPTEQADAERAEDAEPGDDAEVETAEADEAEPSDERRSTAAEDDRADDEPEEAPRSRRRSSETLTGRDAERAAEEAWRAREGTSTGSELAPTIRAAGPEDDPLTSAGGESPPPADVATPRGNEQLSPIQINRSLGARRSEFRACFEGFDGPPIEVRIRITPEGRVSFARATESDANAQVVACLVREIGRLEFDSFDGSAMNVRRTFGRVGPM